MIRFAMKTIDLRSDTVTLPTDAMREAIRAYGDAPLVYGDPGQLGGAFWHLLVNAAQAIPQGAVDAHRVRIRAFRSADTVVVEVSDTGAGIPKEQLARYHLFRLPQSGGPIEMIARGLERAEGPVVEIERSVLALQSEVSGANGLVRF